MSSLGRPNLAYNAKFFIEKLDLQTSNNILNLSNLTFCNIEILSNLINSNVNDINTINDTIGTERVQAIIGPFGYVIEPFVDSTGLIHRIDDLVYDVESMKIVIGQENEEPSTGIFNRLELIENTNIEFRV